MQRLKALIMVTFGFSRSEARAFIILLPLIFLIVFIEPVYQSWFVSGKPDYFDDTEKLDSLMATWQWNKKDNPILTHKTAALFHFDPNTVSIPEMDSLGIPDKVRQRVDRYRVKGGKFKARSDFARIYGLDSMLFVRLEPFIDLPISVPKKVTAIRPAQMASRLPANTKVITKFDLNSADTAVLNSVYGIGPTLALRIVSYRERLGGFMHPDQLYEVWGLDSAVVLRTLAISEIAEAFVPKLINLNAATERELASHPYMKPKTARLIVAYRFQHGNFTAIGDLEKINLIDTKTFNRIKPYLTLE